MTPLGPSFSLGSLADNELCGVDHYGRGTYTAAGTTKSFLPEVYLSLSISKLFEGLKGSVVTSLKCATAQSVRFSVSGADTKATIDSNH